MISRLRGISEIAQRIVDASAQRELRSLGVRRGCAHEQAKGKRRQGLRYPHTDSSAAIPVGRRIETDAPASPSAGRVADKVVTIIRGPREAGHTLRRRQRDRHGTDSTVTNCQGEDRKITRESVSRGARPPGEETNQERAREQGDRAPAEPMVLECQGEQRHREPCQRQPDPNLVQTASDIRSLTGGGIGRSRRGSRASAWPAR